MGSNDARQFLGRLRVATQTAERGPCASGFLSFTRRARRRTRPIMSKASKQLPQTAVASTAHAVLRLIEEGCPSNLAKEVAVAIDGVLESAGTST